MAEKFASMFVIGSKSNALGRTDEVVEVVLMISIVQKNCTGVRSMRTLGCE